MKKLFTIEEAKNLTISEVQDLYKKYCDPSLNITPEYMLRLKLFFNRFKYIFPVYFETKIRQLKRKKYNLS